MVPAEGLQRRAREHGWPASFRRLLLQMARRLGWLLFAFWAISLLGFVLIHRVPGAAGASAGSGGVPLSQRQAAELARLFFLDLPILFNPRPRGLSARIDRLCGEGRQGAEGASRLVACGTACLPAIANQHGRCAQLPATLRSSILSHLRQRHPALGDEKGPVEAWARGAAQALSAAALARLATTLQSPASQKALRLRGSAAVAVVVPVVLRGDTARARSASEVLSQLTGIAGALHPGDSAATARQTRRMWSRWWWYHQRDYRDFTSDERFWGHLSETRYAKWVTRVVRLDFGNSLHDGEPVAAKVGRALPLTFALCGSALVLAFLIAIPLGTVRALCSEGRFAQVIDALTFFAYALPPFWVALLLIWFFGGGLFDLLPTYGIGGADGLAPGGDGLWERLRHLLLPLFCLTYGTAAVLSRYQYAAMAEVMASDYIRAARARGLSGWRLVRRHALRNGLAPMAILLGLLFPFVVGGSMVVERIFGIPGMGLLAFDALLQRDYPLIMAVMMLSCAMALAGLVVSDLLVFWIDPRTSASITPEPDAGVHP